MDLTHHKIRATYPPPISRKKRPIRHGVYVRSPNAVKVRSNRVTHLVNKALACMPWIRDQDIPTLRSWAQLEVIKAAAFAGIVHAGVITTTGKDGVKDVQVRRLVHDFRQLALAQLAFETQLGMTPASRAQIADSKQSEFDLVQALAQPAETAEDAEPEPNSVTEKS
jgi:hypothetical protein